MQRFEKIILSYLVHQLGDLRGKILIDIAGMPTSMSRHLLDLGVTEIHGVNLDPVGCAYGPVPAGYFHHVADARSLPNDLPIADAVVSFSALEHLPDLSICLREAFAKLKSGGSLIMHGGALWPSVIGHHVWVSTSSRNYFFGHPGDPMPPWGHLTHTERELREVLATNVIPTDHIELICESVYRSLSKNRRSASDIREDFAACGQLLLGFTEFRWSVPNKAIFSRIARQGHNYSVDDLMTAELIAVMQKF